MLRYFVVLSCFLLAFQANALTLIIEARRQGHTPVHMTYVHVAEAGYDSVGVFIIRLRDGREISLGRRSHWEKFDVKYIDDDDQLTR